MGQVVTDNVTKVYDGSITAVNELSLEIADGEFVSIVGPSGSGKSTLMRMIAGLENITEGEIQINERIVNDIAPENRGIAMVFQNYALYPHMTVRENMSYGLKFTKDLSNDEIQKKVDEIAEMMGIEDYLNKKPGQLSGGQQQRVATGRAIVREPEVFLLDEPLSNLDAKLKLHMRTELQRIQDELGITTLYVTHDQEEAMTMSDRIVVINEGELQQIGTPKEIYDEPANLFVANFIGSPSMNFFDVQLTNEIIQHNEFKYELPISIDEEIDDKYRNKPIRMGIRPEAIDLSTDYTDRMISATVDVVEPVGSNNYIYILIGDTECTVSVDRDTIPESGDQVGIEFNPSDIHFFDLETEENILIN